MQTVLAMAKDKTFNLRLDEKDRARLDMLAEHYSAPGATVVRMLIKEKADAVEVSKVGYAPKAGPFDFGDVRRSILHTLSDDRELSAEELANELDVHGYTRALARDWKKTFPRALNELRRDGWLTKEVGKYRQTPKASALWVQI